MLQWMGGSKRKVKASRKSTHNRQKQYFEQRKRQQQVHGHECPSDTRYKRAHCHEEPRSLDILSLSNLETATCEGHGNQTSGATIDPHPSETQMNPHALKLPTGVILKNTATRYSNGLEDACPEASKISTELSAGKSPQKAAPAQTITGQLDGVKIRAPLSGCVPNNGDTKPDEDPKAEVSVFDLLGDDGPKTTSEGRSVPEAHVAFCVEGLGKIGMETPAHSPRLLNRVSYRGFPSATKGSCQMNSLGKLESTRYNRGLDLISVMDDIRIPKDSASAAVCTSRGIIDQLEDMKSKWSKKPFTSTDVFDDFNFREQSTFSCEESRGKQLCDAYLPGSFGITDAAFLHGRENDAAWKNKPSNTDDHPSVYAKAKRTETFPGDSYSMNNGDLLQKDQIFDFSDFRNLKSERKYDFGSFDWERYAEADNCSDLERMFDPHAWSFSRTEGIHGSMSLLSEESCSSSAVREKRRPDLHSSRHSNTDDRDMFHISSTKYDGIEKFSANEARHCIDTSSAFQDVLEPDFISLFKEECDSIGGVSPTSSCQRNECMLNTRSFKQKPKSKEDLFDLFDSPKAYFATELDDRKSTHNFSKDYEPFNARGSEITAQYSGLDFELKKSARTSLATESHFQELSHAEDFPRGRAFHFSKERDADERFRTSDKLDSKMSAEKRSLSSENSRTALDANRKDNSMNCDQLKDDAEFDGSKIGNPSEASEKAPIATKEAPIEMESHVEDIINRLNGGSPVPLQALSQVCKRDSEKELSGFGRTDAESNENRTTDKSYQVMLESYVLQLLCVQKVLLDASDKDMKKV